MNPSKSIFLSKTFYFNLAMAAIGIADILPPKYSVPLAAVGNMALRLISSDPTHIIPPS